MGCVSAAITAPSELHAMKEVQASQIQAAKDIATCKAGHSDLVNKMRTQQYQEIKELNERIAKMIESKSEAHSKMLQDHMSEKRTLQERHSEEIRRLQDKHHCHMKDELMRHIDDVRRLQTEYRGQLKAVGVDMRYMGRGSCCGGPTAVGKKDTVYANTELATTNTEPALEP